MEEQEYLEPMKVYDPRRRCRVANSEGDHYEDGYFHMWFIPPEGWPKALVELESGKMIAIGYRKIIFESPNL